MNSGIRKYKSIIKKKERSRLDVLISTILIDSNISNDFFFLLNNVLKGYEDIKEEIKK